MAICAAWECHVSETLFEVQTVEHILLLRLSPAHCRPRGGGKFSRKHGGNCCGCIICHFWLTSAVNKLSILTDQRFFLIWKQFLKVFLAFDLIIQAGIALARLGFR